MSEATPETTEEDEEPRRYGLTLYMINTAIRILIEDGVDPDTGEIGDETNKALDDLGLDRDEKVLAYGVVIKEKRAEAAVYKAEEERLYAARKACEKTADDLRETIYQTLKDGWHKVKDKAVSIHWRAKRGLTVTDEEEITRVPIADIPVEWHPYLRATIEIAKTKLQNAIDDGSIPLEVYQRIRKAEGKSLVVK